MLAIGTQVMIIKEGTPLHQHIGTITEYSVDNYYNIRVNHSSINGWYLEHELVPYSMVTRKEEKGESHE